MTNLLLATISFLTSIYTIHFNTTDGTDKSFNEYSGKKILIVNIATGSPLVSQLEQLEALYQQYHDSLEIVAFPSNSFYKEPRADSAIRSFCQNNYHISFPLAAAGPVIGSSVLPVYGWLADSQQNGTTAIVVLEDFQKILLDRDGALIGIFSPSVEPSSPLLVNAITGN